MGGWNVQRGNKVNSLMGPRKTAELLKTSRPQGNKTSARQTAPTARQPASKMLHENADFVVWQFLTSDHFSELAPSVANSLRTFGFKVNEHRGLDFPRGQGRVIVFGANMNPKSALRVLPANSIVFQSEQYPSRWFSEDYYRLLRSHVVWEMSNLGREHLVRKGCRRVFVCRVGAPVKPVKDIDVLFLGAKNERRRKVLDGIRDLGYKVCDHVAWGDDRRSLLRRSKVLLNIHYYEGAVIEMVRLFSPMSEGSVIVSETGADRSLEADLDGAIVFSGYDDLVSAVSKTLALSDLERESLVELCRAAISKRPQDQEVLRCLASEGVIR